MGNFYYCLCIMLIVLKVAGYISLPWAIVLLPTAIPFILVMTLLGLLILFRGNF